MRVSEGDRETERQRGRETEMNQYQLLQMNVRAKKKNIDLQLHTKCWRLIDNVNGNNFIQYFERKHFNTHYIPV
jgi:hypothetical protein